MKQADLGLNMQQWFTLSDPAMEESLHEVPLYRELAGLDNHADVGGQVASAPLRRAWRLGRWMA